MIAVEEAVDLARLLLDLLIVIVAARFVGELCERVKIPAVLGEIAAGVLIGPSVLGAVQLTGERGVTVAFAAEVGVLLLLVQVGMEMDLAELGKVGGASLMVAVIGVALPFAGGAVAGLALGEEAKTAVFLGAALTATSVGITARVFGDLRALATTEARVVIGAAVADDVLGLVILTVVVKVVTGGQIGVVTVSGTFGLALLFLVATGAVGLLGVPRLLRLVDRSAGSGATVVIAAIAVVLAFAELADAAKLAFIIGAFMAGLALGRSEHQERIATSLGSIGNLFIPVFFAQIGINADLAAMIKPKVLGLASVLIVIGVVGKVAAGWGAVGVRADRFLIGLGMIPRGEVGLIFASIGLSSGVLDDDLYGALLVVVLVTTVMTPPLLRLRLGRASRADDTAVRDTSPPQGGWVQLFDGEIRLVGDPPDAETVAIALQTALLLDVARPSGALLDWFARHRRAELQWDPDDTPLLLHLLRHPDAGAWRLLEAAGVLERALPEVDAAMRRRRADLRELDPLGALRFPVVEALSEEPTDGTQPSERLVLAAFASDVCRERADLAQCAADLALRLGRFQDAQNIADLTADARLLRDGSGRPDVLDENEVLQLATHLASPTSAREAFTLARCLGDLDSWHRDALATRERLVQQALNHPEISGSDAVNLAGARRQAAVRLATTEAAAQRLHHAPVPYLLSYEPEELALQARLVEPLPRSGVVRVSVSPDPEPDHWRIDVACRDTAGLLARLAGALVDKGLDVVRADVATWPDGAVVDSFVVRAANRPRPKDLALSMEAALRATLRPSAMPDLTISFDNSRLPWHTACVVSGPDVPGVLQAVAAAFNVARVDVHTARIVSSGATVNDQFTVSDRYGRKLDEATTERVRRALREPPPRRPWRRRSARQRPTSVGTNSR